jgi:thioesterase III
MSMYTMKVRPYQCDSYGHVNNARYLEFFEEARWQLISSIELDDYLKDNQFGMVVVSILVNYKRPALPNDNLQIFAKLGEMGNSSFTIHQQINLDSGELVATADVKCVVINLTSNRPQKISENLGKYLKDAAKTNI